MNEKYWIVWLVCITLICAFGFWVIVETQKQPMCNLKFGISADLNVNSDFVNNVKINGMDITAPCGSDLYQLANNLQRGV